MSFINFLKKIDSKIDSGLDKMDEKCLVAERFVLKRCGSKSEDFNTCVADGIDAGIDAAAPHCKKAVDKTKAATTVVVNKTKSATDVVVNKTKSATDVVVNKTKSVCSTVVEKVKREKDGEMNGPWMSYGPVEMTSEEKRDARVMYLKQLYTWILNISDGSLDPSDIGESVLEEMMNAYPAELKVALSHAHAPLEPAANNTTVVEPAAMQPPVVTPVVNTNNASVRGVAPMKQPARKSLMGHLKSFVGHASQHRAPMAQCK